MKQAFGLILAILTCAGLCGAQSSEIPPPAELDLFKQDVRHLSAASHRLAGSDQGSAAAQYIESRLRQIGVEDIQNFGMKVWQTKVVRCQMSANGSTIPLYPMRANLTVPSSTPVQGITGPLRYIGRGTLAECGTRSLAGSIVVLEYDCQDNWRKAFAMGARAVIFLGDEQSVSSVPKYIGMPINLVRLFADAHAQSLFDFRRDHDSVTVVSHVQWVRSPSKNILAFLPGNQPKISAEKAEPEMVVLSANYDSYGEIPTLAPGARAAANVAGVLDAVAYFKKNRPKRDMLFMFLDNQARFHEGARNLYDALMMRSDLAAALAEEHRNERTFTKELETELDRISRSLTGARPHRQILAIFKADAEQYSTSLNQSLMLMRMGLKGVKDESEIAARKHAIDSLTVTYDLWNQARSAVASGFLQNMGKDQFDILLASAQKRIRQRLYELDVQVLANEQGEMLRKKYGNRWIALHLSYDFSDGGTRWGPMFGDASDFGYSVFPNPSADNPSHYSRILRAVQDASRALGTESSLHRGVLADPSLIAQYVPARIVTSNVTAGTYGIYNMSLVTYHDARVREGHPSDVVSNLQAEKIKRQVREANVLVHALSNSPQLSLPRVFADNSLFMKVPRWSNGKSSGFYVGLSVSGSIAENSPASDAVVLVAPGSPPAVASAASAKAWRSMDPTAAAQSFDRFVLEGTNADGRFKLIGLRKDQFLTDKNQLAVIPITFDSLGQVTAVVNIETSGTLENATMFPSRGFILTEPVGTPTLAADLDQMQILQANADAPFRRDQSLSDAYSGFCFFYVHRNTSVDRVKMFRPRGAVVLGASAGDPYGKGYPISMFESPPEIDKITAEDLWQLNEARLDILRTRGVTSVDLELLQSRAQQALQKAETTPEVHLRAASLGQSSATSRLIYHPVKEVMNDLIKAVVVLLLLVIPFAFALERLLVCSSSIYGRLGGFAGFFSLTFFLMYWMHPGFRIASAPLIVFLAFAIMLLTSMVIYIMVRKFRTEIMAYQGKSTGLHQSGTSQGGTLIAAVNMGMSTMRRRPIRTLLTCVTVVMLTFTILCFASLSNMVGVRAFYEGPVSGDAAGTYLIHKLDCSLLPPDLPDLIRGREGDGGLIAEQWWLARSRKSPANTLAFDRPFAIANMTNKHDVFVGGIMGIDPEELGRWEQLAQALEGESTEWKRQQLQGNGVFLPRVLADELRLKIGDSLLVMGRKCYYAGWTHFGQMQRIKHLDGKPILPVDFTDASYQGIATTTGTGAMAAGNLSETAQKDFMRLNANQVAVLPKDLVKELGGTLNLITIYSGTEMGSADEGRRLAELTGTPVWARGKEGIERMVFTRITEVSGVFALIIPIILGGLILFGTLLGSITDRQKEIYTFSALGLSPGHVGFLFLAEAGVYAAIGGVGGQLLAQALALGASYLAHLGYIQQPSINFSSTNSLFAIGMVMGTVLISAIYPAIRASKSANPGVQRSWKMPVPQGDVLAMKFPFTVSTYDITGVVSFLAEHFREHDDAGLGLFAAENVQISRNQDGNIVLSAHLSLAPFDLGITEDMSLMASASEIEGIDEVLITTVRRSGAGRDWIRANRTFMHDLRKQFLLWRTLTPDVVESYRMATLQVLGESVVETPASAPAPAGSPSIDLGIA